MLGEIGRCRVERRPKVAWAKVLVLLRVPPAPMRVVALCGGGGGQRCDRRVIHHAVVVVIVVVDDNAQIVDDEVVGR